MTGAPYNPLDKLNLARSIEVELLGRDPVPLATEGSVRGAGVYAIYYSGDFAPYWPIRCDPASLQFAHAIYVGKAIPKGGRKGGLADASEDSNALRSRLKKHAKSIQEVANLDLPDFWVRFLTVDDIWIPLGENMLIESLKPVWNRALDGFGNNDPGVRRATQFKSPWDVLHPGRPFAVKLADSGLSEQFLIDRLADYFAGRTLQRLPKVMEVQSLADE
jgi:hypothetical protein